MTDDEIHDAELIEEDEIIAEIPPSIPLKVRSPSTSRSASSAHPLE